MVKYILDENSEEMECKKIDLYPHQKKILHFINKKELQTIKEKYEICKIQQSNILHEFDYLKQSSYGEIFLEELENNISECFNKFINVIMDKPILNLKLPEGTGKSYIILSIIEALPTYEDKFINIIIVPTKLINQWEKYIKIFNPTSKVLILNTRKSCKEIIKYNSDGVIVLLSNTIASSFYFYSYDQPYYRKINETFMRIFLDDPLEINNGSVRELMEKNNVLFKYKSIASFCSNNYVTVKEEIINNAIKLPEINLIVKEIKNRMYKFLLTLNCTESTFKKFDIDLFDNTSELFQEVFEEKMNIKIKKEKLLEISKDDTEKALLTHQINCLNSEIENLKERILNENCIICLKTIFKPKRTSKKTGLIKPERCPILLLCCKISICNECIINLENCVYCKKEFKDSNTNIFKTKLDNICRLKFNENSKVVLIGNNYHKLKKEMLDEIAVSLFGDKKYIKSLEGSSTVCNKKIENFKNNNSIKILYFPDVYKVIGFNMEFVTDLILMDIKFDTIYKEKLLGPFQRNGRKTSLNVFEFKYCD